MESDVDYKELTTPIATLVRRGRDAETSFEYNCHLRRLYPWDGHVETKRPITEFGCVLGNVPPNTVVERHSHDEEETLIIISGRATVEIGGQYVEVAANDVIYIPRNIPHHIENKSDDVALTLVDIYWDLNDPSNSYP